MCLNLKKNQNKVKIGMQIFKKYCNKFKKIRIKYYRIMKQI